MLGTAKALEVTLEGAPVDAHEAYRLGLVHRVIPEDELLAETQAAARLATRNPVTLAELKRAIYSVPPGHSRADSIKSERGSCRSVPPRPRPGSPVPSSRTSIASATPRTSPTRSRGLMAPEWTRRVADHQDLRLQHESQFVLGGVEPVPGAVEPGKT
jgi:hypothetical protein